MDKSWERADVKSVRNHIAKANLGAFAAAVGAVLAPQAIVVRALAPLVQILGAIWVMLANRLVPNVRTRMGGRTVDARGEMQVGSSTRTVR
jgi:hypothetical protein